jgi:hypothetical protein
MKKEITIKLKIQRRDSNWNKRLDHRKGDLFWADKDKFIIITKDGARSAFTTKELLEIERNS